MFKIKGKDLKIKWISFLLDDPYSPILGPKILNQGPEISVDAFNAL